MAAPMEADVDQRLSMSLDDLIASKKKAAPKGSAAGKTGSAGRTSAEGTAKKPAAQRRKGAKGKQPATAGAGKTAAGGADKRAPVKKRGGRGGGMGGVLIRGADGRVIGAVGISGDTSDNDEACAVAGIAAAGFTADTGA